MWAVYESRKAAKALDKLPPQVLKKYEVWKNIVSYSGVEGLMMIKGFHDEALAGRWRGCRSSRLSRQYRVIYTVRGEDVAVRVIDVTPHDYRR